MIGTIIGMIIIGAIAGFLASLLFNRGGDGFLHPSGLIGSVIGAIIALLVYNATVGKKSHSRSRV